MFLFLLTVTLSLMFLTIFLPAHYARQEKSRRQFEDEYRLVKLAIVRAYYPELKDLTDRQIALRYDYDDAYWKIR